MKVNNKLKNENFPRQLYIGAYSHVYELFMLYLQTQKNMIIFKVCLHIKECKETKFVSVDDLIYN